MANIFYNIPRASASHGPPFFEDTTGHHFYSQDTSSLMRTAWNDKIDPSLKLSSTRREHLTQDIKMSLQIPDVPLERFLKHNESHFLFDTDTMPHHPQGFPSDLNRSAAPIQPLPQVVTNPRLSSPCPSHDPTSTCGSARTPGPEIESNWYDSQCSPMVQSQEFYIPQGSPYIGQGFPDWTGVSQSGTFPQQTRYPCVQMSQIQGLPDLQQEDSSYDHLDEGYNSLALKLEYVVDPCHVKYEHKPTASVYHLDEGLGASIKDEGSLPGATSDIDADGEDEELEAEPILNDPLSEDEYSPTSKRTTRRKSKLPTYYHAIKNGHITKSSPKSRGALTCKQCDHAPFKDFHALQRHITSSHTRAFICVFHFAGCAATFTSKNEWKRHVSSQHLNLTAWVCELGTCGKNAASGTGKAAEFNRKDLFTQHLRRMHTPIQVKRNGDKRNPEWEEKLKELQISCLVVKREAPVQLGCPVQGCNVGFDGPGCWDDRMEHVGKHLERAGMGIDDSLNQDHDRYLVEWALREGIIEYQPGCHDAYRLCVEAGNHARKAPVQDADAYGEDDF